MVTFILLCVYIYRRLELDNEIIWFLVWSWMLNAPHKVHVLKGMIHKYCLEVMDVRALGASIGTLALS